MLACYLQLLADQTPATTERPAWPEEPTVSIRISLAETGICLALLGLTLLGMNWLERASQQALENRDQMRQAVAIANGQSELTQGLAYEDLSPTETFEPAGWIHQPGYAIGEIPVIVRTNGDADSQSEVVYSVSLRSENADPSGNLRRIAIRVEWQRSNHTRGQYQLETLRAS